MSHLPGIVNENINPWESLALPSKTFHTFKICEIQLPKIDLDSIRCSLEYFLESFRRHRGVSHSEDESLGGKCSNVVCYLQADSCRSASEN
jgi:hypothetical protein